MLKIHTDTGHTGVGEATNWPGSPIIEAAARHVGERVIGLDPMRTDFIWTKLYRDLNTNLALTPAMQDRAFEVTKVVREAVGPEMDMMIETHAMMNGQMAVKMAERLAPLGMTWYEEPAGPENAATLRALRERLAKAAKPHIGQAKPGVFIVMGSNHAFHTIPGCFPYNVAKCALTGLVQSLAIEWGPAIRVVGVAPGFIDTPGNQAWFDSFPDPSAERDLTNKRHPAGRIGTPEEVGNLCAFLASPPSGFITGNTILIDGGRSALMQD